MIKKNLVKGTACIVIMSMIACMCAGCGNVKSPNVVAPASAAEETKEDEVLAEMADSLHSDTAGKTETVYVIKNGDGTEKKIVSEWLKNPDGADALTDVSELDDIEVTKGDAKYEKSEDGSITWTTSGADVYYRGTTDKELPVDVEVSYNLDGKDVSVSELEGKSGHLTVTYKYINNTGKEQDSEYGNFTVYQPFVMMTGVILSNKEAVNIEVEGGTSFNDGDRTVVMGMGFPGMTESLGLDEIDLSEVDDSADADFSLPEETVVECDVENFSEPLSLTVAAETALDKLGISEIDTEDLSGNVDKLTDALDQLYGGTGELKDGAGALNDGAGALLSGVNELTDGADKLSEGTETYKEKMDEFAAGTKALDDGAAKLTAGIAVLAGKVPALTDGVSALLDGATALAAGLDTITANNEALNSGAAQLVQGLGQLRAGVAAASGEEAQAQMSALLAGSANFKTGLAKLTAGLNQIVAGGYYAGAADASGNAVTKPNGADDATAAALGASITDLTKYYQSIEAGVASYDANLLPALLKHSAGADASMTAEEYTALVSYQTALNSGDEAAAAVTKNYIANLTHAEEIKGIVAAYEVVYGGVYSASAGANALNDSYAQIDGGINQIVGSVSSSMATLLAGIDKLSGGAASLQSGIAAYTDGVSAASAGAAQLKDGLTELNGNVPALSEGVGALDTGAKELLAGADKLSTGAAALSAASADIYNGAFKLSNGAGQLTDGTKALCDGMEKLYNGTIALNDGVSKFDKESIMALADAVTGNLGKYGERTNTVRDYSGEFTSFGGAAEDVECSTVFVFRLN